jgi:hypothetical protein
MSTWIITTNTDVLRTEAQVRRESLARDWARSRRHGSLDAAPARRADGGTVSTRTAGPHRRALRAAVRLTAGHRHA